MLTVFNKIARLPEKPDYDNMKKCNTVEARLTNFFKIRVKKCSFNFLSDNYT